MIKWIMKLWYRIFPRPIPAVQPNATVKFDGGLSEKMTLWNNRTFNIGPSIVAWEETQRFREQLTQEKTQNVGK